MRWLSRHACVRACAVCIPLCVVLQDNSEKCLALLTPQGQRFGVRAPRHQQQQQQGVREEQIYVDLSHWVCAVFLQLRVPHLSTKPLHALASRYHDLVWTRLCRVTPGMDDDRLQWCGTSLSPTSTWGAFCSILLAGAWLCPAGWLLYPDSKPMGIGNRNLLGYAYADILPALRTTSALQIGNAGSKCVRGKS